MNWVYHKYSIDCRVCPVIRKNGWLRSANKVHAIGVCKLRTLVNTDRFPLRPTNFNSLIKRVKSALLSLIYIYSTVTLPYACCEQAVYRPCRFHNGFSTPGHRTTGKEQCICALKYGRLCKGRLWPSRGPQDQLLPASTRSFATFVTRMLEIHEMDRS